MTRSSEARFTGWHLVAVMVAFFGVIIGVNVFMAVLANTSWTGLVVKNSYVAGLEFNEKSEEARAQDALGWKATLEIVDGGLRYALVDASGSGVTLASGSATFWRPTSDREDVTVNLDLVADTLTAPVDLGDGVWIVAISVDAGLDHPYRDTRRIHLKEGTLR
jgi:nitrogen fixation protein FixH